MKQTERVLAPRSCARGLLAAGVALLAGAMACTPDKVERGPTSTSGSGGLITTVPATGGTATGGVGSGGASGGTTGGTTGTIGTGGTSASGGFSYVPPAAGGAGGAGGATSVTWTVPPTNKDAAVAQVCHAASAPGSGKQHQLIMVVKSIASPGTIPPLLKTHLETRGFKVDYAFIYTSSIKTDAGSISNLWFFDDAKTQVVDMSQYGLAVVTKDGYKSGANLENIPVLCGNNQTADTALAMATSDGSSSSTKSAFTLLDPKHPIAAGKTGDLAGTVLLQTGSSADLKLYLSVVPATAHIVGVDWGVATPGTSAAALFAYEVGDLLADGSAAKARRVGFFLDDSTTWGLVTAGSISWEFFDASVDWLLGLVPCSGNGTADAGAPDANLAGG